ncbi:H-2 class II histocompatibility antigen, A-U alpha chain-like [Hoplias malabaricus]|uniref:H-2 class II histocompatibility antigen, A-U alpha chain-like n=1 Tax=Hoplias malabaricus TaxID=27720 RepID=UPI003461DBB8
MKLCLILVCAALISAETKVKHQDVALYICSDSEREFIYGLDGEEMWHADFSLEKGVMTLPQFADPFTYEEGAYESAVANIEVCRNNLGLSIQVNKNPAIPKVAPQSSVYTKSSAQLGSKNTLICHITGFYPPHVEVSWTRNNVNVTNEASLSRYYINTDDTFNLISHLSFTPEEGDIYSCSVQHTALDRALTKTWDVQVSLPGVGASVFCGVGLAGGLLGVAVGTFFLIKGNNCN